MRKLIIALIRDEHGQDLLEYALLSAFVGFAGLAAYGAIRSGFGLTYVSWDTANQALWRPGAPPLP